MNPGHVPERLSAPERVRRLVVTKEEIDRISDSLAQVDFPAGKNDILERVGDAGITVDARRVRLGDLIQRVPENRFESVDELMERIRSNVVATRGAPTYDDGNRERS